MSHLPFLFVYGSLRSGFQHPAYAYMRDHFTLIGEGYVNGALYDMGEYPAAIPSSADKKIVGELYQLAESADWDWVIAQLDDYEGISPEEGEPTLYRRETTTVILSNGAAHEAWIYWFNGSVEGRPEIDSGDVLAYRRAKG